MLIEIINAEGRNEYIVFTAIESFEAITRPSNDAEIPCVAIRLASGRALIAQHDTLDEFRERMSGAKAGLPIGVQKVSDTKRASIGPISPLTTPGALLGAAPAPGRIGYEAEQNPPPPPKPPAKPKDAQKKDG